MKWRLGFLMGCVVIVAMAGSTVASTEEAPWTCCEENGSCPGSLLCCSAEAIGMEPCTEDSPNFCLEVCKRVAGATFTPDRN